VELLNPTKYFAIQHFKQIYSAFFMQFQILKSLIVSTYSAKSMLNASIKIANQAYNAELNAIQHSKIDCTIATISKLSPALSTSTRNEHQVQINRCKLDLDENY